MWSSNHQECIATCTIRKNLGHKYANRLNDETKQRPKLDNMNFSFILRYNRAHKDYFNEYYVYFDESVVGASIGFMFRLLFVYNVALFPMMNKLKI